MGARGFERLRRMFPAYHSIFVMINGILVPYFSCPTTSARRAIIWRCESSHPGTTSNLKLVSKCAMSTLISV